MAISKRRLDELRACLRRLGASHAAAIPTTAGHALEAWTMMRLARAANASGRWTARLRLGDAAPLPTGAEFIFPSHQGPIQKASRLAPGHVLLTNVLDPTRAFEMHNSVQWLGRSGTTHECDISVLPEVVAASLRTVGGMPQGLPVAMFECKDRTRSANIDEMRQTLARMFDLALVTLPRPGEYCRIYDPVRRAGWGTHRKTYIASFDRGAFGQVRTTGFATGSIKLARHYRIFRAGDVYRNRSSIRYAASLLVNALDTASR